MADAKQSAFTLLGANDMVAASNVGFLQKDGSDFTNARMAVETFLDELLRLRTSSAVALGTTSPLAIAQVVATTGSPRALTVTGAAHTTLTASTEAIDVDLNLARTVQFAAGTLALQRAVAVKAPTYGFASASTLTAAASVSVEGPPVAGTNATITDSYALLVRTGAVGAGVTRAYGLAVFTPSGAGASYGAYIEGSVGIGITTPQAKLDVRSGNCLKLTQVASTSGTAGVAFATSLAAHVGLTASSEALDVVFNCARAITFNAGANALQRSFMVAGPTLSYASASTITDAATQWISGGPVAGSNATLTRSSGLLIASAAVGAGTTTGIGLQCIAPTGATNNYAALFSGTVLLSAGTTTAAPLQLTSGTSLTSPVACAIETTTDDLFFTITTGTARKRLLMADPVGGLTSGRVPFATTNGRLTDDASLAYGTATGLSLTQAVSTTGSPNALVVAGGAHTTLTASTEAVDVNINLARTVQFATGALATQRAVVYQAPTYAFVGASTITNAATVAIAGAPVKGTNATITNTHALLIQAGATSTAAASYGLTVNAQTGGTANYAAQFIGGNVGVATSTPAYTLDVSGTINGTYIRSAAGAIGSVGFGNVNYASDSTYYAVKQDGNGRTTVNGANSSVGGILLTYDNGVGAANEVMRAIQTNVVFNESGADRDFRIEGDTNANLFALDAGLDAIGIGAAASSSAFVAIAAGTTAKGPLQLTSGTNLTTPVNGTFEYDGTNLYFTTGGTRKTVTLV
jgi:hypothetical protein